MDSQIDMNTGTCRLCLKEKPLLKKSHILSSFFYGDLQGDDNEMYMVSLDEPSGGKKVHTGEFEGGLLCQECDGSVLSKYENYGKAFFFGRGDSKPLPGLQHENQIHPDGKLKSTHIKGVDYSKLKLFLLSVLWRASISSRPFFSQVNLGKHEEAVRQMLLSGNPGSNMDFPSMVSVITDQDNKKIAAGLITPPTRFRVGHCISYQFQIGRLVIMFFVSSFGVPDYIQEVTPNNSGELRVIHIEGEIANRHMKFVLGGQDDLHNHLLHNLPA
jgi:hypothetical protein